jgi:RNA polymerase sigma-70 factor (ECF subfamily)
VVDERRSERTDADLVTQVVDGDEQALAELYDRHADAIFRLCFRLLGDRYLAEEVMQETYLALWNRAELFDRTVGSLPAWLMAIARNRSVDRLRARGRRPPAMPISSVAGGDGEMADLERTLTAGTLVGSGPGPPEP